ncbi:MAG: apolipoprotein A1/A4/E family protein [Actinobacteria bacterium]|nr:apolipoprotein A1/A4/E family protein [Actinomycetota bacterium]MBU1608471.1 apolipoprotein A1/A4/E family protein [Actinomycetota bacterium]MBU2316703.1 apolipoprotein A1/A4/E family protein [Actinomycetota bacterium]MBU2385459.1 apolipoprotein A1/A4/E family protein [Actinomycetota bacterium]
MGGLTIRNALGGPWASHWLVWVSLYPPTTLLVLLRETVTPFPHWWWPLLSATAQHLVVGVVIALGAALGRRRHTVLPLAVAGSIWGLAAIVRGVIGGAVAGSVAGVDPEYVSRIVTWVVASALWVPVFVYTLAQFDRRRLLLGSLDAARRELDSARDMTAESADDVQRRLRESVRQTLQPVLDDLQGSLSNSRESLSRRRLEELSAQLSRVHDEVAAVVDAAGNGSAERTDSGERASVRRAFDVRPGRPAVTALLVTVATITLIVPDAWRVFGHLAAIEVVVATVVAGLFLGVGPAIALRTGHRVSVFPGQAVTVVSLVFALGAMTQVMLASGIDPITWHGLVITPLIAVSLILASVVFALASALFRINEEAGQLISETRATIEALTAENDEVREREGRRLAILMHGPIQGRLAACVMALNFHTTAAPDPADEDRVPAMLDSILAHLTDVSADLVALASLDDRAATPEQG